MSKDNCIIRSDFIPQHISSEKSNLVNTQSILEDNYYYIVESMEDEEFKLENPQCNLFKELLYEDKVVGFVTYDLENGVGDYSLNEVYILPKYRGNGIFFYEIEDVLISGNTLSIYEPNHMIMQKLVDYDFARYLDDNIIATSISLDLPTDSILVNDERFRMDDSLIHASNLYDMNMSMVIILFDISTPGNNIIGYSRQLESDKINYDALNHREKLDDTYFKYIQELILSNHEDFINILTELTNNLPRAEYTLDEIVGTAPGLSFYLEEIINEGLITRERAYEIQEQITNEFENEVILPESLMKRLMYLSLEDDMREDLEEDTNALSCPYCGYPTSLTSRTCNTCGYSQLNISPMDLMPDDKDVVEEVEKLINHMRESGMPDEMIDSIISDALDDLTNELSEEFSDILNTQNDEKSQSDDDEEDFLAVVTLALMNMTNSSNIMDACGLSIQIMKLDPRDVYDYILDNQLADVPITNESFRTLGYQLKLPELKDILRKNNLKVSGNKKELIERIADNIDISTLELYHINPLNDDYQKDILVTTQTGLKFIEEHKHLIE